MPYERCCYSISCDAGERLQSSEWLQTAAALAKRSHELLGSSLRDTDVFMLYKGFDGCIMQTGGWWVWKVERRLRFCCWTSLLGLARCSQRSRDGGHCAEAAFWWGRCHRARPVNLKCPTGTSRGKWAVQGVMWNWRQGDILLLDLPPVSLVCTGTQPAKGIGKELLWTSRAPAGEWEPGEQRILVKRCHLFATVGEATVVTVHIQPFMESAACQQFSFLLPQLLSQNPSSQRDWLTGEVVNLQFLADTHLRLAGKHQHLEDRSDPSLRPVWLWLQIPFLSPWWRLQGILLDPAWVALVAYFQAGHQKAKRPFLFAPSLWSHQADPQLPVGSPVACIILSCLYNLLPVLSFTATKHASSSGIFTRLNTSTETVS